MIKISQYIIENFHDHLDKLYVSVCDIFPCNNLLTTGSKKYDEYIPKNSILVFQDGTTNTFSTFDAKHIVPNGALPIYDVQSLMPYVRPLNKQEKLYVLERAIEAIREKHEVAIENIYSEMDKIMCQDE